MRISRLDIYNVRNIQFASITPNNNFNFIIGVNGSGKSALLEAIFMLSRARSFRTSSTKTVINYNQSTLTVTAEIQDEESIAIPVGIQSNGKSIDIRINHQTSTNKADLAYCLPLQIIHPRSYELLDAGSQKRREYIDWGIFHQDRNFIQIWRRYKKALLQRNTLLKAKQVNHLKVWNNELVIYGTMINDYRLRYLEILKPYLMSAVDYFIQANNVDIRIINGWCKEQSFAEQLESDLEKDLRFGFTHSGPHREDFQVLLGNKLAKDVASRGQLKLLVICLKIAQLELFIKQQNATGCILIDDFSAELDKTNRHKLLQYLHDIKAQSFITATDISDFDALDSIHNKTMFHVEHGTISS